MRVIAGELGGRLFDSPGTNRTHPMSDKVRGALFAMLGDIEDLSALDAFAGTGALSFEAASRGARPIITIESDKTAQKIITQNIAMLNLGNKVKLISATANAWLQTNPDATFDLVLLDPPYNDLQRNLLYKLAERVKADGILVLSWPGGESAPDFARCELLEQRNYGDAQLVFYRKTG